MDWGVSTSARLPPLHDVQARTHFAGHPLLRHLDDEAQGELMPLMRRFSVRRGTVICRAGESTEYALSLDRSDGIVLSAESAESTKRNVVIALQPPATIVLVEDLLAAARYGSTVRCRTDGAVWRIPRERLLMRVWNNEATQRALIEELACGARLRTAFLNCVLGGAVTVRLRRLLQFLESMRGSRELQLTHADIAGMLGVSRQQVTLALHRLAAAGEVNLGYRKLLCSTQLLK